MAIDPGPHAGTDRREWPAAGYALFRFGHGVNLVTWSNAARQCENRQAITGHSQGMCPEPIDDARRMCRVPVTLQVW
jgi:hypothetical protein